MFEKGFDLLRKGLWIWSGIIVTKAIIEEIAIHKQRKAIAKLPKYFKYVGKYTDGGFTPGRIYECLNPANVNAEANFIDDDGEIIRPGASEAGFWRVKPNNVLEVVISHNTGITEGWLGHFDGPKIQLAMDQGYSAPSAKIVTAGVRLYGLVEGELFYAYDMAAEGQTLQAHIWSTSPRSTD
jgi:hypothetical protein